MSEDLFGFAASLRGIKQEALVDDGREMSGKVGRAARLIVIFWLQMSVVAIAVYAARHA